MEKRSGGRGRFSFLLSHCMRIDGSCDVLADWDGTCSVVGSMDNPTHDSGDKARDDGNASLKSGLSGETLLGGEMKGERRGSLMKRLFRRKLSEDKGKE